MNTTTKKATLFYATTKQVTNTAEFNWQPWIHDGTKLEQLPGLVLNRYIRECLPGVDAATIYLYEASDKTYPSGRPISVNLTIYNIKKQVA